MAAQYSAAMSGNIPDDRKRQLPPGSVVLGLPMTRREISAPPINQ